MTRDQRRVSMTYLSFIIQKIQDEEQTCVCMFLCVFMCVWEASTQTTQLRPQTWIVLSGDRRENAK